MATALIFDISGKQRHIFSTTMLRSIVGASARMDMLNSAFRSRFSEELVYSGGGNGVAVFADDRRLQEAEAFLSEQAALLGVALPRATLQTAGPDLDWDELDRLQARLAEVKRRAQPAPQPFSFPLADQCQVCGRGAALPGTVEDKHVCFRCREKLVWGFGDTDHGTHAGQAHQWIAQAAYQRDAAGLFMLNLEQTASVCRKWRRAKAGAPADARDRDEERSLMAVVCMDGNGMGRRIEALREKGKREGRSPHELLGAFSDGVEAVLKESLKRAMHEVFGETLPQGVRIPLRPLIAAGDDICLITAPETALDLTRSIAAHFAEAARVTDAGLRGVTLSAGIAVVHSSFPVSEAVGLAEELLSSAKRGGQEARAAGGDPPAMVDFAVVLDAKMDALPVRRRRECVFAAPDGKTFTLTRKPYRLTEEGPDGQPSLACVQEKAKELGATKVARSKIKALREILREGPDERADRLAPYRREGAKWKKLKTLMDWHLEETDTGRKEAFLDIVEVYDFLMENPEDAQAPAARED